MIFALGPNPLWIIAGLAFVAIFLIVVALVDAILLQGACSLVNWIAPGPHGTNLVRRPRFRQALGMIAVAVVVNSLMTCFVLFLGFLGRALLGGSEAGLSETLVALVLGFIVVSDMAASLLDAPFWRSALVMFVPDVIAFGFRFPQDHHFFAALLDMCGLG